MKITTADIAKIPTGNLRVPEAEFTALWATAEELHDHRAVQRIPDWYSAGVVATCRWLARATVHPVSGPSHPARSPILGYLEAHQNLIEAEYIQAVSLALRQPPPTWLAQRPGWIEGIEATLLWAWHQRGNPPMEIKPS